MYPYLVALLFVCLITGGAEVTAEERHPPTLLGEWKAIAIEVKHEAKTDGFLVAYLGGAGTSGTQATLETAASQESLMPLTPDHCAPTGTTKGRVIGYSSAMIPVKRGEFYRVGVCAGSSEHVTAYWLPLRLSIP